MMADRPYYTRHPSTQQLVQYFRTDHLDSDLAQISKKCADLVVDMLEALPDGPELTVGLRKLLEAKDCFVRHALASRKNHKEGT
jgi:hypothetical protein